MTQPVEIMAHPSEVLDPGHVSLIRQAAPIAEIARQLITGQLELIYDQNWFKVLTPKNYGGLEMDLNEEVRLIEALAWADGSLGWVVTLCTGAGWFGGFLNPAVAEKVFADREVCLAGSGAPTGTATINGEGYLVNGTWRYASGALNTTHFTTNCRIFKNGVPVLGEDGKEMIRSFIFYRSEVNVIPAWGYSGMVATGSHSFEVKNVQVPFDRTFRIDPEFTFVNGPLYTYPFLQLAEATLAVNISGMVIHFIDLCHGVFARKSAEKSLTHLQQSELDEVLAWSTRRMMQVRDAFYVALDKSWANYAGEDKTNLEANLKEVTITSRRLATKSRQIVDKLYPYCGLEAARTSTELNRVWRDVHTASQHALLTFTS